MLLYFVIYQLWKKCLPALVHSLLSPIEDSSGVNNWFDFKNAITTGFGLVDTSTKTPLAGKRKRVLRKQKVRANA